MSDDKPEEGSPEEPASRGRPSLRGFARRMLREGEPGPDGEPRREDASMTRDLLIAAMATGDKARTEIVRLLAREVRGYLEALELHKDLNDLITNYSLEVHASVSLKPLREDDDGEIDAKVELKRKT